MAEYKEISRTSSEIERIKLKSEGCNLDLVSVSVTLLLILFFAMILSCIFPLSHNI